MTILGAILALIGLALRSEVLVAIGVVLIILGLFVGRA